ncbi:MAG: 3-deoxy-manno-octulosonate cytidylyltransferase [Marinilabiliaceae bacterium]|nr:3-deoxy-manno-octulosonate cytidylyltransferase [Marinilabiliaceae bacterium]
MDYSNTIGIIPARFASTRFPGKPLVDLGGKTMIQRVFEQAQKAIPTVFVATDDERIFNTVESFGGNAVMTSKNHQSGTDRCAEALSIASKKLNKSFNIVVNIQGDEPFIEPAQIAQLINCFNDIKTDIATLVKPITSNDIIFDINKPKVIIGNNNKALYFSRSPIPFLRNADSKEWHLKHKYYQHIGMYAYRSDVLFQLTQLKPSPLELAESLEQLRWIENGYHIAVSETSHESIGIDTPNDLEKIKNMGLF